MNMRVNLDGKVAVVTGGGQGIGRAYSEALAASGAAVVVADLNLDGAHETAALIEANGGSARAHHVDVSSRESTRKLADEVRSSWGTAHIIVNNAAIYHSMRKDTQLAVDIDYWRRIFAVNLDGALLVTQAFAPFLIEQRWGRVINQASVAAYVGRGGDYAVSKLALVGLTQGFANELGAYGVTCNAIAPGMIMTEATRTVLSDGSIERISTAQQMQKPLEPEDLIGALLFLASDAAAYITGQTLIVDAGYAKRV